MKSPYAMQRLALAVLVGGLAITTTASAQDASERWYATASVGMGTLSSSTLTFNDGMTPTSTEASYEASFAGGGTLGYRFSNNWSVEGEIMYRRNELEPIDVPGLGAMDPS